MLTGSKRTIRGFGLNVAGDQQQQQQSRVFGSVQRSGLENGLSFPKSSQQAPPPPPPLGLSQGPTAHPNHSAINSMILSNTESKPIPKPIVLQRKPLAVVEAPPNNTAPQPPKSIVIVASGPKPPIKLVPTLISRPIIATRTEGPSNTPPEVVPEKVIHEADANPSPNSNSQQQVVPNTLFISDDLDLESDTWFGMEREYESCPDPEFESGQESDRLQSDYNGESQNTESQSEAPKNTEFGPVLEEYDPGFFDESDFFEEETTTTVSTRTPVGQFNSKNWWGLPKLAVNVFHERGIKDPYQWQKECLDDQEVLAGKSLVYSMPTSGGKSFVAEISLLRWALMAKKKAMLILPFVSIVAEKTEHMKKFAERLKISVDGYYASQGLMPLPVGEQILICTIEKANIVINQMIEDRRIQEIGAIIIDEFHMIGDGDRGFLLELILTKVLYVARGYIQIIGMSATIPNLDQFASWLDAKLYVGTFRPVPLKKHFVYKRKLYDDQMRCLLELEADRADPDGVVHLVKEVTPHHSVLVFCSSKQGTQTTAELLSRSFDPDIINHKKEEKIKMLRQLRDNSNSFVDQLLVKLIPYGVAYHHSGLTTEERKVIEEGYRSKAITVITCTSTLAAGVNLPARRVIIKSPFVGIAKMTPSTYLQMCGRAGRAGMDTYGESFLIANQKSKTLGQELLNCQPQPIESQLRNLGQRAVSRLILEAVGGDYAQNQQEVWQFLACSFHQFQSGDQDPEWIALVKDTVSYLIEKGFVRLEKAPENSEDPPKPQDLQRFFCTPLGRATYCSSFSAEEAIIVAKELETSMNGLVLIDDLQLCYLSCPLFDLPEPPDWASYFDRFNGLSEVRTRIAEFVGVNGGYLNQRANGQTVRKTPLTETRERIAKRFFCALMLSDLVSEASVPDVAKKYGVARGVVQSLMQNASLFSQMMATFAKHLEYFDLEMLLVNMRKRLDFGVKQDIIPLVEIPNMGKGRARVLWSAGYRSVQAIAAADAEMMARHHIGPGGAVNLAIARKTIANAKLLLEFQAKQILNLSALSSFT